MQPKILITGASGFIGSFLVERFLSSGLYEVYAGIRSTSSKKYLEAPNIRFFNFDLNDIAGCHSDLRKIGFDYVIHNAGITQTQGADHYESMNTRSTQQFYAALAELTHSPRKFTYMSSIAAYGPADFQLNKVVTNESVPHPVTAYGRSKLLAERLIIQDGRIPYSIIRPSAVYGPRETNLFTFFKMINNRIEAHIGRKAQKLTFIYIKDLVELVYLATTGPLSNNAYFAGSESYYSSQELGKLTKRILEKRTFKINLPVSVVQLMAGMMELWSSMTGKYSILNKDKINEFKSMSWVADLSASKRDLDFVNKYSLEEGLEETIGWYKDQGWL